MLQRDILDPMQAKLRRERELPRWRKSKIETPPPSARMRPPTERALPKRAKERNASELPRKIMSNTATEDPKRPTWNSAKLEPN
jgi:hypothetical protein